ncbi:EAL domain-containing protein [Salidesulfovibrio brasiliensis]|uniref:EAL domain-containing protein n=1 Tax=Salidesulfovibrio brasiliensis TaxID=221711 RepID=UPI0006D0DDE8|nr:EAL domain-containing protein [Salidesulfovibrio brasiliensis]
MKALKKLPIPGTVFGVVLPALVAVALLSTSIWVYLLPNMKEAVIQRRKETIRELTQTVITQLGYFEDQVRTGRLTMPQAKRQAAALIRDLRYGSNGKSYFWINTLDAVVIAHPYRLDHEGRNLSNYTDPDGKKIFLEFIRVARNGGGFVSYTWQWNDQQDRAGPKTSYVDIFKPWGWVVGTGVYQADIDEEFTVIRNRASAFMIFVIGITAGLAVYVVMRIRRAERGVNKAIRQRERLIAALKQGEERYRTIADFAYDWEVWVGTAGEVNYCSPSCERITGRPPESFFERPRLMREIVSPEDRDSWDAYVKSFQKRESGSLDFRIRHPELGQRWLSASGQNVFGIGLKPLGIRFSIRDVTSRKHMEDQLRHQALHDPLTGLANRNLCLDRVHQAMERSKRRDNYFFAVVFLDLDRFKLINDSLGHHYGDKVLTETARRLQKSVRGLDTVARFGGDEFVLLLDELVTPGEAIRIVKRVRKELARPFDIDGHEVTTSGSFGIVLSPTDYEQPDDLLQNANIAMHHAKEAGRNHFKAFTSRMLENAMEQLTLENDMRKGLESGEFFVEYQPIVLAKGNMVIGFEALARWTHPKRGSIAPSEFIPVAEETGMINELGIFVLQQALKTLGRMRAKNPNAVPLFMAVNISAKQFSQLDFFNTVSSVIQESGMPGNRLKLELTESAIMNNPNHAIRILDKLKRSGVMLSIDDFGTGYSSLTQLQHLPVDTLKIDRSFVSRMVDDHGSQEIVKAIIALAHSLSLDVVAEGVEYESQLQALRELGCESIQGFLLHRPQSEQSVVEIIDRQAPLPSWYIERLGQRRARHDDGA